MNMRSEATAFTDEFVEKAKKEQLFRQLLQVENLSAREIIVNGKQCLDFSSNDYLALRMHPEVKAESCKWLTQYGVGCGSSRLISGNQNYFGVLEEKIAAWKNAQKAIIIGSGYMANTGAISALADRKTAIFSDRLNHASINAGCQLSGGKVHRYKHKDYKQLEMLLQKYEKSIRKIIISDTVFSMDGDFVDTEAISSLAEKYEALIYYDDAHGSGVYGDTGQGIACAKSNCDIAMGTFSKAMGSYGAYIACSKTMQEYLVNRCGSFIYTTALPPAVCGAISKAIDLVQTSEYQQLRVSLSEKARKVRLALQDANLNIGSSESHIIPVILNDAKFTLQVAEKLREKGIFLVAVRPPTVPKDTARLRISLNVAHSDKDIEKLIDLVIAETRNYKKFVKA